MVGLIVQVALPALTICDLDNVTDYLGFESFCTDLISRQGYSGITQLGDASDKGRDAIHRDDDTKTEFAFRIRDRWRQKYSTCPIHEKRH